MAKRTTKVGPKALTKTTPNVSYKREELVKVLPQYVVIDDAIAGAVAIKRKGTAYLPMPSPYDKSKENTERYEAYRTRAVWYGATARTLTGFVGEVFAKDPVIVVPPAIKPLTEDTTGEGVGIIQLAKLAVGTVLSKGRGGLFVDYPSTGGAVTQEQRESGGIRAVIQFYDPTKIINWRTKRIGSITVLSLVVLEEEYDKEDDGFARVKDKQWRVLRLTDENTVEARIYRTSGMTAEGEPSTLTKHDGTPFNRIPFMFIGSETNNALIDRPPMFDLADLNIAHYRNSADYEESAFICGQPTPVITGLTESWADKYFNEGVGLGSRGALPLPVGADAKLMQAEPNTMPKEAMEAKERQMVALGAKLVEQKSVQRTATEASAETAAEKSVLATVADNVSLAFQWALGYACDYEGVTEREIVFRLNKEYSFNYASPEAIDAVIRAWQADAISFTEMRQGVRKSGIATLDDKIAKKEIQDDNAIGFGDEEDPNADPTDPNKKPTPDPDNVPEPGSTSEI
jgi:hypothetical protein